MSGGWPIVALLVIVAAILVAARRPALDGLFRRLPVPLWCYALPAIAVELGWMPGGEAAYPVLSTALLPFALGLILLGTDLPAIIRSGARVLLAALAGTASIVLGTVVGAQLLRPQLPPDAWKGAGALAGTWTGGTMNLLSLRDVLEIPETLFATLVVIDAVIAYSWMAILVAASAYQGPVNRWLGAAAYTVFDPAPSAPGPGEPRADQPRPETLGALMLCGALACGLAVGARALAGRLPTSQLVSSATGWTVLLVTTAALGLSLMPRIRRLGARGSLVGYPVLYLVLAATGAQADLEGLWSTPAWIAFGAVAVLVHGGTLLLVGRTFRIPLGVLATSSQANIGGVVSGPLVGAVYHRHLAPIGLVLAVAGNALGTYVGLAAAALTR